MYINQRHSWNKPSNGLPLPRKYQVNWSRRTASPSHLDRSRRTSHYSSLKLLLTTYNLTKMNDIQTVWKMITNKFIDITHVIVESSILACCTGGGNTKILTMNIMLDATKRGWKMKWSLINRENVYILICTQSHSNKYTPNITITMQYLYMCG